MKKNNIQVWQLCVTAIMFISLTGCSTIQKKLIPEHFLTEAFLADPIEPGGANPQVFEHEVGGWRQVRDDVTKVIHVDHFATFLDPLCATTTERNNVAARRRSDNRAQGKIVPPGRVEPALNGRQRFSFARPPAIPDALSDSLSRLR